MKKILLSLALFVQLGAVMADNQNTTMVQVRHENVKMFQQPGTSAAILETIATTDRVELLRKWNAHWALVTVNGKAGYVLLSELANLKTKTKPTRRAAKLII